MPTHVAQAAMDQSNGPTAWRYMGMGLELAGAVGVMTLIGYGVDHWLDSEPVGLVVGASIGVVGGMYNFIREALRANRLEDQNKDKPWLSNECESDHDPTV